MLCHKIAKRLLWCALLWLAGHCHLAAEELDRQFDSRVEPLLKKYCYQCHSGDTKKGEVDLSTFRSLQAVQANFKLWQLVLQQIEEEEMPPKQPLPSDSERAELVAWVRGAMNAIDWSKHRQVGRVTLPRLTKQEYNNTLRDLLGIDLRPGDLLLDDGQGNSGFTNDRDSLFISPALAEQYFDAADYALQAVLALNEPPLHKHFEAENMLMTERSSKPQQLPGGGFGYSLAGAGQRTLFDELSVPADGWYRLTVLGVGIGGDSGMRLRIDNQPRHDFRVQNERPQEQQIELLLRAGTHQMTWNIEALKPVVSTPRSPTVQPAKAKRPKTAKFKTLPENAAELVNHACAKNTPELPVPEDSDKQTQELIRRFNASLESMQRRIEYLRLVTPAGSPNDLRNYYNLLPERTLAMAELKKQVAEALKVSTTDIDRRLLDANAERIASNHKVLEESLPMIGVPYDRSFLFGNAQFKTPPGTEQVIPVAAPGVDWIRIEGPIMPSGSQPTLTASLFPSDAQQGLSSFLIRAFRRPLKDGELDRYMKLYERSKASGQSHLNALKLAFAAALTSPKFLFRDELNLQESAIDLDDHQIANRLSYFLWLSMPDDQLRELADAGQLRDETTLRTQVARMLADPKSRAFVSSFLGQWLGFDGLGTEHIPDAKKFRQFNSNLAEAIKLEPVLTFENLLRSQGSLIDLLDSHETYVNADLAALYSMDDVTGSEMKRVGFTNDHRGGLLGMAAVLIASSTPNRTSPVLRGKWVLENLLGRHLAEPPADAGQLDDQAGERGMTVREELEQHRRHASCAACHDKIDPIGFGLENFDAIGRYRANEVGKPVDASGELPGGLMFSGPAEMRSLIKSHFQDEFVNNVTRRMAAFAIGRAIMPQDEGFVRQLIEDLKRDNYRIDKLIEAIVLSDPFRKQGKN